MDQKLQVKNYRSKTTTQSPIRSAQRTTMTRLPSILVGNRLEIVGRRKLIRTQIVRISKVLNVYMKMRRKREVGAPSNSSTGMVIVVARMDVGRNLKIIDGCVGRWKIINRCR